MVHGETAANQLPLRRGMPRPGPLPNAGDPLSGLGATLAGLLVTGCLPLPLPLPPAACS